MYLNIEKELNPEQLKAATTIDGPILILAGAGSGKTKTITYRMYYMIEVMNIHPDNILAVSFTNKAAMEMEHRLKKLIGSKADKAHLSTFHSLGVKILKQEIEKLGYQKNFDIFDTSDQLSVVREALHHLKAEKNFDRKIILQKIGLLKNMGISEDDFKDSNKYDAADPYDEACEHVYHYYQEKLKFYNAIDFDDILFLTIKLFRQFPQIKERYSTKFKYIMVDEYQDTNDLQFELIRHLTCTHNNLCVVGDDDQSIYAFRGANVTNILNFPDYYKPCKIIKLEQNYRSHQSILNLANNVIKNNVKRSDKKLWTNLPVGEKPHLWSCQDPDHEVSLIVEEIQRMQKEGVNLSHIAILFRSNNQMQIVEDQLRLNNIPHYIVGGQKFYDKKEIKDIISYLSLIQNFNNDIALRRIINTPQRGIGKSTLEKYIEFGQIHKCSILNAMIKNPNLDPAKEPKISQFTGLIFRYKSIFTTVPLPDAIKSLMDEINYDEHIEKSYDLNHQIAKRKKDVTSFIESSVRFEKYQLAKGQKGGLKNFLEKLLLVENSTQDENNNMAPEEEMGLFTLHSSKGLEFEFVFLIGVEEDLLPHKRTIAADEDISEERRLFYVGITRARQKLIMTYCQKRELYGKEAVRFKSRFLLEDATQHYTEVDRTTFNHLSAVEVKELKKNFFSNLMDTLD